MDGRASHANAPASAADASATRAYRGQATRIGAVRAAGMASPPGAASASSSSIRASPMSRSRLLASFSRQRRSSRADRRVQSGGSASSRARASARRRSHPTSSRPEGAQAGHHLVQHARRTPRCRCACPPASPAPARDSCRPRCPITAPPGLRACVIVVVRGAGAGRPGPFRQPEVQHLHRPVRADH